MSTPLAATAADGPVDLKELFALLAGKTSARAHFVETRYLTILNEALVSSGTLRFEAPNQLEKRTLKPAPEIFSLVDGTLTVERPDENLRRTFELQREPVLWAFVEAFRATLAGDLAGLERFYSVNFDATADGWRLRLKPTPAKMRKLVDAITVQGAGADVTYIEIRETGGDRTVMAIVPDRS